MKPLPLPYRAVFGLGLMMLVLFWASQSRSRDLNAEADVITAIEEAHGEGRLDAETALVYRVWAALDPERLPEAFARRPRRLRKSLTPVMLEVRSRWTDLSLTTRSLLLPYLQRPTEQGQEPFAYGHSYLVPAVYYDSPGGHFRIWYVTSTDDAPELVYSHGDTIPDWIHLCAEVLDHVWAVEVDSLNYRSPPADGAWYEGEDYGGDERYDVYIENLNRHFVYGYTQSEFYVQGGTPRATTSYLVMDDDYAGIYPSAGEEGLKVTAAHEFFHAIQFAYDTLEERFFMEISSTWMEDVVYDEINDYYYYIENSGSIFGRPEKSLTTFNGLYEYSACIWNHYLARRHGTDLIRQIWQGCIHDAVLNATEEALHARSSSLSEALHEFAIWNAFTGPLADTVSFYPEGHRYPQVQIPADQIHSQLPVSAELAALAPEPLGASYVRFELPAGLAGLAVEVTADPSVSWRASLLGAGPSHRVESMAVDGFGHGEGLLTAGNDDDAVLLVMTPFSFTASPVSYGYQARADSALPPPAEALTSLGQNYPNPAAGERTVIPFTVAGTGKVTLRILTLDGRLVREFDWGRIEAGDYYGPDPETGAWDLTNASGERVAAGLYLYQLRAGDAVETRKMAVLR
jgi:hypothetical protein